MNNDYGSVILERKIPTFGDLFKEGYETGAAYVAPFENIARNVSEGLKKQETYANEQKLKEIFANPPTITLEDGTVETDYETLARYLLPYDRELAKQYAVLAENTQIKQAAALQKQQSLENKFDLSTVEGKLQWKKDFELWSRATWQPGFKDSGSDNINSTYLKINNLIKQAEDAGATDLLNSIGNMKPFEIKEQKKMDEAGIEGAINKILTDIAGSTEKVKATNYTFDKDKNVTNASELISKADSRIETDYAGNRKEDIDKIKAGVKSRLEAWNEQDTKGQENVYNQQERDRLFGLKVMEYKQGLTEKAYNSFINNDSVKSSIVIDLALDSYDKSNKDLQAKRNLVYEYIKSYNTGTVLDSELNSTIASSSKLQGIATAIKKGAGFDAVLSINDSDIDSIIDKLNSRRSALQTAIEQKRQDLSKVYPGAYIPPPKDGNKKGAMSVF